MIRISSYSLWRLALVLALSFALAACGPTAKQVGDSAVASSPEQLERVFQHLRARSGAMDAIWIEQRMAEMVPSQTFSIDGARAQSLTQGLVIGKVSNVAPGSGYVNPGDAPKSSEIEYDSAEALWRVVEVTVEPEQAWGPVAGKSNVTFGLVIDAAIDPKEAIAGLRALDRVVVSLDRTGRFDHDPSLYSVSHGGEIFGTVDESGRFALDAMEEDTQFLDGIDTVNELASIADAQPKPIDIAG